jgi:hypothetical protein
MTALAEALTGMSDTVGRLGELSRRHFQNPYESVRWPETLTPEDAVCTAPELTSLCDTPLWGELDERARRRLTFFEAVNFYSLNIHGEKALMAGLASRLYRPDLEAVTGYLHHFLDEENKHSIFFGEFCRKYAGVYRSRQVTFAGTRFDQEQEDFLFFAKTMIFEEIVDHYNQLQARDERLHPVARFINHNHHVEEARHLIFGRRMVATLWAACGPGWTEEDRRAIRDHLTQFLVMSWREYYNPDVYADCGLPDPWEVAETAWRSPAQRAHRRRASQRCLDVLLSADVLTEKDLSDAFDTGL